jgi:hypothetical protein
MTQDRLGHFDVDTRLEQRFPSGHAGRRASRAIDRLCLDGFLASSKSMDQATHLQVDIDDGYTTAISQTSDAIHDAKTLDGVKALEGACARADHMGYVGLALESRLRLGEAELENGNAKAGRSHLKQLQTDDPAPNFGGIDA